MSDEAGIPAYTYTAGEVQQVAEAIEESVAATDGVGALLTETVDLACDDGCGDCEECGEGADCESELFALGLERLATITRAYAQTRALRAPRGPAGALTADEQLAVDAFLNGMERDLMADYDDDQAVLFRALSKLAVNAAFEA